MENHNIPLIIFDTDMDTDCDDAGALGLLLKLQNDGKARLLAAIVDTPSNDAAPCIEAICKFYNADVPIGAVNPEQYKTTHDLKNIGSIATI